MSAGARSSTIVRRFTLLEMMVVVAIVAVLAAFAIPAMAQYKAKSQRSEAFVNVRGIRDTGMGVLAANIPFHDNAGVTVTTLVTVAFPVVDTATSSTLHAWTNPDSVWRQVGWEPDGPVRCAYTAILNEAFISSGVAYPDDATGTAYCNVDNDATIFMYREDVYGLGQGDGKQVHGWCSTQTGTGKTVVDCGGAACDCY